MGRSVVTVTPYDRADGDRGDEVSMRAAAPCDARHTQWAIAVLASANEALTTTRRYWMRWLWSDTRKS